MGREAASERRTLRDMRRDSGLHLVLDHAHKKRKIHITIPTAPSDFFKFFI